MGNRIVVAAMKTLFEHGEVAFDQFLTERSGWGSGIDSDGYMAPHYVKALCTDDKFPKPLNKILEATLYSDGVTFSGDDQRLLRFTRMLDESGQLTRWGKYKAISSLGLSQQLEYLDLPSRHFSFPKAELKASNVETLCFESLRSRYACGFNDEGGSIRAIYSLFKGVTRQILRPANLDEQTYAKVSADGFMFSRLYHFLMSPRFKQVDLDVMSSHFPALRSHDIRNSYRDEFRASSEKACASATMDMLIHELRFIQDTTPFLGTLTEERFKLLIESFGLENMRRMTQALFDNPMSDLNGWSDLSFFDNGMYFPVEVKKDGDKLHFAQIETLDWLQSNFPEFHAHQVIARVAVT